jgi:hypothetical protein
MQYSSAPREYNEVKPLAAIQRRDIQQLHHSIVASASLALQISKAIHSKRAVPPTDFLTCHTYRPHIIVSRSIIKRAMVELLPFL